MKAIGSPWSSLVLLGALSCGGESSHSSSQGRGGAGGNVDGITGTAGSSGSSGGRLDNGGASSSAGSASIGSGGTNAPIAGAGSQAGSGTGGALGVGTCVGPDIDVPVVTLSGAIKLIDTPAGDYGTVQLTHGTDVVTLGTTTSSSYSVRVVPGIYDVTFKGTQNGAHLLKTGVTVPPSGPAVLDIDIPNGPLTAPAPGSVPDPSAITVMGKLTIDGQPNQGLILSFRKAGTDNWVRISQVMNGGYSGLIAPGSYDASVLNPSGNPILPGWGYDQILSTGIVVPNSDPAQVDIDVRTAPVSGAFTIDGAAVPNLCKGSLRGAKIGSFSFSLDSASAFSGRVLPETYDVIYRGGAAESPCPMNTSAIIKRGVAVSAQGLAIPTIDIPSVVVSGKLTLGGAALSNSDDDGTLSLATDEGDAIALGRLSAGTFSTRVIPGTYDIYFDVMFQAVGTLAPLNHRGKIKSVQLAPGMPITLDIDVPSPVITGAIKVGGSLLDKMYDGGRLWLGDPKGTAGMPLGWTSAGKYSARVLPGRYDLYYQATSPSALAPINASAKLGCFVVQ